MTVLDKLVRSQKHAESRRMKGNRNIAWVYRDGPKESEAPLGTKLVKDARGNNKGFSWYRVSNSNFKKKKQNLSLLLNRLGDLVVTEAEKAFMVKFALRPFLFLCLIEESRRTDSGAMGSRDKRGH